MAAPAAAAKDGAVKQPKPPKGFADGNSRVDAPKGFADGNKGNPAE